MLFGFRHLNVQPPIVTADMEGARVDGVADIRLGHQHRAQVRDPELVRAAGRRRGVDRPAPLRTDAAGGRRRRRAGAGQHVHGNFLGDVGYEGNAALPELSVLRRRQHGGERVGTGRQVLDAGGLELAAAVLGINTLWLFRGVCVCLACVLVSLG